LVTLGSLKSHTSKSLAQLAKQRGIEGWHAMRKEELIKALVKHAKRRSDVSVSSSRPRPKRSVNRSTSAAASRRSQTPSTAQNNGGTRGAREGTNGARPAEPAKSGNPQVLAALRLEAVRRDKAQNLATPTIAVPGARRRVLRDRVVLIVRDAYWLQAYWEVTPTSVKRAQVALAEQWHAAQPTLRLFAIQDEGSTHGVEQTERDITVHGCVRNWYIDVNDPPRAFRVGVGYKTPQGRFHLLAKSNKVTTPLPSAGDVMDHHWTDIAENYQKYFALSGGYDEGGADGELREVFEQQLRRPMSVPSFAQFGAGHPDHSQFAFHVDAEMIIYGATDPEASVTLAGEPVKLQNDGSFAVRAPFPDRRQVLPVVACSRDGTQQRTTVLAVERNTKVMEPLTREPEDY
jgi:hypothetical protein